MDSDSRVPWRVLLAAVNLYTFTRMDPESRAAYLWAHGEFITGIVDSQGRSNFYTLHDFFAEVELTPDGDSIAGVHPFSTGSRLDRLLTRIDLWAIP